MTETATAPKEKIRFKDIINRNLVLVILVQIFNNMSVSMMSAFMNMGASAAGVSTGRHRHGCFHWYAGGYA